MTAVLKIKGPSVAEELRWTNSLFGRQFENVSLPTAIDTMLGLASGWSRRTTDTGLPNVTARFDDVTCWAAIGKLTNEAKIHFRHVLNARQIDVGAFGVASGLILANLEALGPAINQSSQYGIITSLQMIEESKDLWNKVIPIGAGEGNNKITLRYSTRVAPYTIQSAAGPDGELYYFIEDAASVALYQRRTRGLAIKDIMPLSNSAAAFEHSANALYDFATMWLQASKEPQATYNVTAVKLANQFEVGDTLRLVYRGTVIDTTGVARSYKSIDTNVVVLRKKRVFVNAGEPLWQLTVSNLAKWRLSDTEIILGEVETLRAFRSAVKPYTGWFAHGSRRESIQFSGSKWYSYPIKFDNNVQAVLQCKLIVDLRALKSNTEGAADGGGQTTTSHTGHTHTINLGTTSTTSAHQHSGTTGGGGSTHQHSGTTGGGGTFEGHTHPFITDVGGSHSHDFVTDSGGSHNHTISGQTAASGGGHSHSVSNHTHDLRYGIFESSLPSNPDIAVWINGVDRTAILGGPFDTDFIVDISEYVTDAEGRPLWQTNTVQFRKAGTSPDAIDLIVDATSLIVATALGPA